MIDLPTIVRDRLLQVLCREQNYLGWWAVPQDGQSVIVPAIEIGDTPAVRMVLPGVSVSIDGAARPSYSRYSGS